MRLSMLSSLLLPIFLFSLLQIPTFAVKKSYIVYLGEHAHTSQPTAFQVDQVQHSHYEILSTVCGSAEIARDKIFYSYTQNINGFAAVLDDEEVAALAKNPKVVSVFLNKGRKLHTTHSWDFLGAENYGANPSSSLWQKARFGEDVIIGNLDTGVWPESKSFSDEGYGPVPSRWRGICQTADGFRCNRKLIGARYFNKGYAQNGGNVSVLSVRDYEGHGSHTLSTAAGSFVPGANIFGVGNGTARGGSPKAKVAAYKVCWPRVDDGECFDADILAAFDTAISDGVDVLSVSLGGLPAEFFEDATSIGSFHAIRRGITVVASGGNDGPTPGTVSNVSPWLFTVGASTIDRSFTNYVELGNKMCLKGTSLSSGSLPTNKPYPLISAKDARLPSASADDAILCKPGTLDPKMVTGKIVFCLRGDIARTEKGQHALEAGAVGMILANDEVSGNEVLADPHLLPTAHLTYTDGQSVLAYINSARNPTAYITPVQTVLGTQPAPSMAAFSSRGPNQIEPALLKPDIIAPGVDIIAAYTEAIGPSEQPFDKRRVTFVTMSGTSMSCPHVSGIVGLLKTLYPQWSPAAIRSAIMTTARTKDNKKETILDATNAQATPFAYGAGHVRPNEAADPGLVYDLTVNDYLNFLCGRGYNQTTLRQFQKNPPAVCPKSFNINDFNYPSISVPDLSGQVTVTRRVKNVGTPGMYRARVKSPAGVSTVVSPAVLAFNKVGEEKTFTVTFSPKGPVQPKDYTFGQLIWSDGKHYVRSTLAVKYK